jgi:hypothetical protein
VLKLLCASLLSSNLVQTVMVWCSLS